jgi:hypothetical protein
MAGELQKCSPHQAEPHPGPNPNLLQRLSLGTAQAIANPEPDQQTEHAGQLLQSVMPAASPFLISSRGRSYLSKSRSLRLLRLQESAIHHHDTPGHVIRSVAGEEESDFRNIIRHTHAAHGNVCGERLNHLV